MRQGLAVVLPVTYLSKIATFCSPVTLHSGAE
jgi:hypothetical protein